MTLKVLAPLSVLLALLSVTAACSKSKTDAPQAARASNEAGAVKDSNQQTKAAPDSPATDRVASSVDDALPTQMNCASDQATEQEIRLLEERRRELQAQLSAGHPLEDPVYLSRRRHRQLE